MLAALLIFKRLLIHILSLSDDMNRMCYDTGDNLSRHVVQMWLLTVGQCPDSLETAVQSDAYTFV